MASVACFEDLPLELIQMIVDMTEPTDYESLTQTNRCLHELCRPVKDKHERLRLSFAHMSIGLRNDLLGNNLRLPTYRTGLPRSMMFAEMSQLVYALAKEPSCARWIQTLDLRLWTTRLFISSRPYTPWRSSAPWHRSPIDNCLLALLDMQYLRDIPQRFATIYPGCCEDIDWDHVWTLAKMFGNNAIEVFSFMLVLHCLPNVTWLRLPDSLYNVLLCFQREIQTLREVSSRAFMKGTPSSLAELKCLHTQIHGLLDDFPSLTVIDRSHAWMPTQSWLYVGGRPTASALVLTSLREIMLFKDAKMAEWGLEQ